MGPAVQVGDEESGFPFPSPQRKLGPRAGKRSTCRL